MAMEAAVIPRGGGFFPSTHWSVLRDARDAASPTYQASWNRLAETYGRIIHAYIRRKWSKDDHEAQDIAQEFFLALADPELLGDLSPHKGRFRHYVVTALDNLIRTRHRFEHRLKRGGDRLRVRFTYDDRRWESRSNESPEETLAREWALSILDESLEELEAEFRAEGKETAFQVFAAHDLGISAQAGTTYESLGERFGLKATDVTNYLYRARRRLRELTLKRVQETTSSPEDAEREMRDLFGGTGRAAPFA